MASGLNVAIERRDGKTGFIAMEAFLDILWEYPSVRSASFAPWQTTGTDDFMALAFLAKPKTMKVVLHRRNR